uniref:Glycine N-acyltransferase-like protein n=1 Tax=Oryzias latipes TaxID=8090 RepID=A0A3P9MDS4_ORYLA
MKLSNAIELLLIFRFPHKRFLPRSLKVYGFLVLRNRVQSEPVTVLVDKWPKFRVIVCKPSYEKVTFKKYSNKHQVNIMDLKAVIEWSRYLCIGNALLLLLLKNKNIVSSKKQVYHKAFFYSACFSLSLSSKSYEIKDLFWFSSGFSLSSLSESHLDLVNQTWKFGKHPGTLGMIRNMIAHFPSRCVLDPEGRPVSWILTYACCAMGMLYTLPEHRGRGYAKALIGSMARTLKAQGYPVFCFVEEENAVSYQLFTSMGFTEDPSHRQVWFGFNNF